MDGCMCLFLLGLVQILAAPALVIIVLSTIASLCMPCAEGLLLELSTFLECASDPNKVSL